MKVHFLPPSAACKRCVRSVGKPLRHRAEYTIAVEAALIGIARAVAEWGIERRAEKGQEA